MNGTSYGTVTSGKVQPLGLVGERLWGLGPPEADPERKAGEPVCGETANVFALRPRELADAEARRDQQLPALEPRRRVGQLRDVHPANHVRGPGRPGGELQPETG